MKEIYLSIVIPCYDEMANLRKGVLNKVEHYLSRQKYPYEVIIVDDGSKDGSINFIKKFIEEYNEFSLIQSGHMGKAGAVTKGVLAAKGKYILFTDMDQATPIEEISKLMPFFEENYDVVIGSRNTKREGAPLSRLVISRANIILRKLLVGLSDITDTQCGFKLFSKRSAEKIFKRINTAHNGYQKITGSAVKAGFDVELLLYARNMGFMIKEVPVNWLYVESRRVNPIWDSIEGVIELMKIRMNSLAGKYK
jgi:glycosyltransferase involved in cell wall biosynthesis